MVIVLATFGAVLAIVFGTYWAFVLRPEHRGARALRRRIKTSRNPGRVRPDLARPERQLSNVAQVNRVLGRASYLVGPIEALLERSGSTQTVGVVVLASLFLAMLSLSLVLVITGMIVPALVMGVLSLAIPYGWLKYKAAQRLATFEQQFPEAIELIARALRAGHAFTTGLDLAAEEIPDPVGAEFRLVYDMQTYGMPLPDALRNLGRRVPLLDARFFVTAVLTQRESGGNLAEVLDNLAELMRERFKVKRQVRAATAHGRITGWVLALLAPALAAVMLVVAPAHISLLATDPMGRRMVLLGILLQIIGVFAIRRIVDIEV